MEIQLNDLMLLLSLVFPAIVLWLYMTMLYAIALHKKDNSIADIGYGGAFVVLVLSGVVYAQNISPTGIVLVILVLLWGSRLSFRIYQKNKGKPEDFRYATWRSTWKWFRLRSYFQVFMLQGAIVYIISFPVLLILSGAASLSALTFLLYAGIPIWIIGFLFEAVGDWQLDRFLANFANKGKLMTSGLWRYSRHPNYFGESLMWWGIWLIATSVLTQFWLVMILSPILITTLLLFVSGVPLLEARMKLHPDWDNYARTTSKFVPWFRI